MDKRKAPPSPTSELHPVEAALCKKRQALRNQQWKAEEACRVEASAVRKLWARLDRLRMEQESLLVAERCFSEHLGQSWPEPMAALAARVRAETSSVAAELSCAKARLDEARDEQVSTTSKVHAVVRSLENVPLAIYESVPFKGTLPSEIIQRIVELGGWDLATAFYNMKWAIPKLSKIPASWVHGTLAFRRGLVPPALLAAIIIVDKVSNYTRGMWLEAHEGIRTFPRWRDPVISKSLGVLRAWTHQPSIRTSCCTTHLALLAHHHLLEISVPNNAVVYKLIADHVGLDPWGGVVVARMKLELEGAQIVVRYRPCVQGEWYAYSRKTRKIVRTTSEHLKKANRVFFSPPTL